MKQAEVYKVLGEIMAGDPEVGDLEAMVRTIGGRVVVVGVENDYGRAVFITDPELIQKEAKP